MLTIYNPDAERVKRTEMRMPGKKMSIPGKKSGDMKYELIPPKPGPIVPGRDNEPILVLTFRQGIIQYKLISFFEHKQGGINVEGNFPMEVLDAADGWVSDSLPWLLNEADVHHTVHFKTDSNCYFDFLSSTLYGAAGKKYRRAINGKPIELSTGEAAIVDLLTLKPGTIFKADVFLYDIENGEEKEDQRVLTSTRSFATTYSRFRQYDPSISDTFKHKKGVGYYYDGNPPEWSCGDKDRAQSLTLKKIFGIFEQREVLAIVGHNGQPFQSVLTAEITPEETIAFLGLNDDVFDQRTMDVKKLLLRGFCDSTESFRSLLTTYCPMLDALWNKIGENIRNSLLHSLRASTYYADMKNLPLTLSELDGYDVTEMRLNNYLRQIYPAMKKVIQSTGAGEDYFHNCDLDFPPEKVIDGVTALVLASFGYCQTASNDADLNKLIKIYQIKLQELIHQKFDSNSGGGLFDPEALQKGLHLLLMLHDQVLNDGQYYIASEIKKIYDTLNFHLDDENSLSHSSGRDL